jgi:hypothetical protein
VFTCSKHAGVTIDLAAEELSHKGQLYFLTLDYIITLSVFLLTKLPHLAHNNDNVHGE